MASASVVEAEQRRHRAEGLLARDRHVGGDVGQDGRLEEGAAERVALAADHDAARPWPRASAMCSSTFCDRLQSISGPCSAPASRPSPTFSSRTAARRACRRRRRRRRPAPGSGWRRRRSGRCCGTCEAIAPSTAGIEVGVVEDDEGRVAAQFQRDLLHRAGALRHQQLADLGRAGEGELAHDRVARSARRRSRRRRR